MTGLSSLLMSGEVRWDFWAQRETGRMNTGMWISPVDSEQDTKLDVR